MKVRQRHKHPYVRKQWGGPNIGRRHSSYEPGCTVCEAHRYYDEFGRFPSSFDELRDWEGFNPGYEDPAHPVILIPKGNERVPRMMLDGVIAVMAEAEQARHHSSGA